MDFGNFLDKMSTETGRVLKLPDAKKIKTEIEAKITPKVEQTLKPLVKLKPKKEKIVEVKTEEEPQVLEEESIEQIYEVTSIIMKTIRQAFADKKIRKMAFESVQNAINMVLGENYQPQLIHEQHHVQTQQIPPKKTIKTVPQTEKMMTESDWDNMPTISYEDEPIQIRMNPELYDTHEVQQSNYTRNISIKPGQGLMGLSEQEIKDLKVLAGIEQ